MDLDENSGLKNYFKEIVKNANKYGEKIDLNQYKNLVKEYDVANQQRLREKQEILGLEGEIRGTDGI